MILQESMLSQAMGTLLSPVVGEDIAETGGFAPTDVSDLLFWLDADNRGSTTNQWDDLSGNGNHFVAPSAGEFPSFASGIASFGSGGADYLSWAGFDGTGMTSCELFIVLKRDPSATPTGTDAGSFGYFCTGTDHYTYSGQVYNSFMSTARKSCGTPSIDIDAAFHVANFWSAASDWAFNIDGVSEYSTASNTFSASPAASTLTIGASSNAGGYYFYGGIKQVLFYSRKLDTSERSNIETYLAALT